MLAQTGDDASVHEVIGLITDLRDEIARAHEFDRINYPVSKQCW